MKKYIFYTSDGETKDKDLNDTENCQIIGWAEGRTEKEALKNLSKEIITSNYKDVCCQELASEKTYYF